MSRTPAPPSEEQAAEWRASGARLRELRQAAGLSQEALSIGVDMDQSTLSKMERMGLHLGSRKRIAEIAEELGVRVRIVIRDRDGRTVRHEALTGTRASLSTLARQVAANGETVGLEIEPSVGRSVSS